jgi:hypothetical protein
MNSRLLDENFYFHFLISELATQNTHPGRSSLSHCEWVDCRRKSGDKLGEFALNSRYQRSAIGPSFYCDSASQHIYGSGSFLTFCVFAKPESGETRRYSFTRMNVLSGGDLCRKKKYKEKRAERNRFNRENNKLFIV